MNNVKLLQGNCLEVLKTLPDNSVDSVVCDPPYGISFMNKKWDYDVPSIEVWKECLRVLKPGGHMLVACGTRTQHRMVAPIEDAGFEIRDVITWLYGSGFPKSQNISIAIDKQAGVERTEIIGKIESPGHLTSALGDGRDIEKRKEWAESATGEVFRFAPATDAAKQWDGWGTALKPAVEFFTLCRKPLSESTIAKNVLKWGTGGINVDGCRVETTDKFGGGPQMSSSGNTVGKFAEYKPQPNVPGSPLGRFPANLILDEEAAVDLDEQSGLNCGAAAPVKKKNTPQSTNTDNYKPHSSVGDDGKSFRGDSGGASRFFKNIDNDEIEDINFEGQSRFIYCPKASKSDRNAGLEGMPKIVRSDADGLKMSDPRMEQKQQRGGNENHHPTVKNTKLMSYLCKLITPPNGTVLDPFMGSGSTGVGALKEGFKFIGIEREAEYVEICKARLGVNTTPVEVLDSKQLAELELELFA